MVQQASKPANGVIPLTGKAADWLDEYLKNAEPDAQAQEKQVRADAEFASEVLGKLQKR